MCEHIYFDLHFLSSMSSELVSSNPRTSLIALSSFHTEHSNRTRLFHGCNCNCIVQLATFTVMVGAKALGGARSTCSFPILQSQFKLTVMNIFRNFLLTTGANENLSLYYLGSKCILIFRRFRISNLAVFCLLMYQLWPAILSASKYLPIQQLLT